MARRFLVVCASVSLRRRWERASKSKALLILALAGACRNATASDEAPARTSPPGKASSDAKHFERELAATHGRWSKVTPPVDCKALLPEAELPSCDQVQAALTALKQTLPAGPRRAVIQKSGALALSAQRAAGKLRQSGLEELFRKQPAPAQSGEASVAGPPRPPGLAPSVRASSSARPLHQHDHADAERVHSNPTLSAILEYGRISSLALRQLAVYLERGPREARAEALRELVRLSREEPRWKNLESLAKEARLTETEAELQRELDKLIATLRAERGDSR